MIGISFAAIRTFQVTIVAVIHFACNAPIFQRFFHDRIMFQLNANLIFGRKHLTLALTRIVGILHLPLG
ncbi:hypothetical protein D1872_293220 [compost metagenome]